MNLLNPEIDEPLKLREIEAAKAEILRICAKQKRTTGFPTISLPAGLSPTLKEYHMLYETAYVNMEWVACFKMAHWFKTDFPGLFSRDVETRLYLASLLLSSASSTAKNFRDAYAHKDTANGDLFIGLALAKLLMLNVGDCVSLLEMAELCCCFHPNLMRLARDKLDFVLNAYRQAIHQISTITSTPESVQQMKDKNPVVKSEAGNVDLAVKEWNECSFLGRYRLLKVWFETPYLSPFTGAGLKLDVTSNSSLFGLPKAALDNILVFTDLPTMSRLRCTSEMAYQRISESSAWTPLYSAICGTEPQLSGDIQSILPSLPLLQSLCGRLEHATASDWSTFDPFLELMPDFLVPPALGRYPSVMDHIHISVSHFLLVLKGIQGTCPPLLEYLASSTNLTRTLARLHSSMSARVHEASFLPLLCDLVISPSNPQSVKRARDLADLGFVQTIVPNDLSKSPILASQLGTYLEFHHYINPHNTSKIIGSTLCDLQERLEEGLDDEITEKAKILLCGVYHFLSYEFAYDLAFSAPIYGTFEFDPSSFRQRFIADDGRTKVEDQEFFAGEIGHHLQVLSSPNELYWTFNGRGRYVGPNGEISEAVTVLATLTPSDMTNGEVVLTMSIGSKIRSSFEGRSCEFGFGGSSRSWDEPEDESPSLRTQRFLLWKSTLPTTESNWIRHMNELELLKDQRSAGGALEYDHIPQSWDDVSHHDLYELRAIRARSEFLTRQKALTNGMPDSLADKSSYPPPDLIFPAPCRGPHEYERHYAMRRKGYEESSRIRERTTTGICYRMGSDETLRDTIVLLKSLEAYFREVLYDLEENEYNGYQTKRLDDYRLICPSHTASTQVSKGLDLLREVIVSVEGFQPPCVVMQSTYASALLRSALDLLGTSYHCVVKDTHERLLTLERISCEMLARGDADFEKSREPIDPIDLPTAISASSTVVDAILMEKRRKDAEGEATKVFRKWFRRIGASSPIVCYYSVAPFLDCIAIRLMQSWECDEPMPPGEQSDEELQSDSESTNSEEEEPSTTLYPQKYAAIALGVAALGIGAYMAGRLLSKRN